MYGCSSPHLFQQHQHYTVVMAVGFYGAGPLACGYCYCVVRLWDRPGSIWQSVEECVDMVHDVILHGVASGRKCAGVCTGSISAAALSTDIGPCIHMVCSSCSVAGAETRQVPVLCAG